jgi:hypothetical protein
MYIRKVLEQVFDWFNTVADDGAIIVTTKRLLIEIDRYGSFKRTSKKQTGKEWLQQWMEQGYFRYVNGGVHVERCVSINEPYIWYEKKKIRNQKKLEVQ